MNTTILKEAVNHLSKIPSHYKFPVIKKSFNSANIACLQIICFSHLYTAILIITNKKINSFTKICFKT